MLTENEINRLKQAIIATIASPVIGSIEDYSWESIFHYVKNIPLSDPALGRTKHLYDAVDQTTKTGWSLKSLQINSLTIGNVFRFVIQRADIIKKSTQLGFPGLTLEASPQDLGKAIIKHWNEKILSSKKAQLVENSYEGILLKTIRGDQYIYCESPLELYHSEQFFWQWTVETKTGKQGVGLQGNINGETELVWYKNQKQLFRSRKIPEQVIQINIDRIRLTTEQYVQSILNTLQKNISSEDIQL